MLQSEFGDPGDLKCHRYFHGLEAPCPWCKNERVFKGETVIWNWRSEKTGRDYELYDLPLKNEDGSLSKLEIFRDITEQKQAEKALIKSDALLKETQALTKSGGWELDVATGTVQWTDEVYRIYGVAPDTYNPNDIAQDMGFYAPSSRPVLKKAFQRAFKHGEPYDLELEFIRANKERIWVRTMARPEIKNGKVVRLSGFFIDITDFKNLVQEQERAKRLLEQVYGSLDEAVFAVDPQTRKILSCNAASEKMFGYRKYEMIGKNTQFLHVDQKKYREFGKKLNRAMASEVEFRLEFSLKDKDGRIFPTEHTIKTVRDSSGLPPIHVSVIRDLTFRKLAENKMQHQQQELENRALQLEESNAAFRGLLDQREKEKKDLATQMSRKIDGLILPFLEKMRKTGLSDIQSAHVDILESNIRDMLKPVDHDRSSELMQLTPTETTIADLIRLGYRNKEIASKISISTRTVEFHRDNIRSKLDIKGRKINLKTYLSRLS